MAGKKIGLDICRKRKENDLTPKIECGRRTAWTAFSSIREVTDHVKDASLGVSTFNASVLPAMCFATETWSDNITVAKAMQTTHRAVERCFLKTSLRQQWRQGLRSSELREKLRLADPLQYVKKSEYRWAGHLLRQKDDICSLRTTEQLPRDHKRPLGRPPTRWTDSFAARDRAVWKSCGPR
ncbi:hypothetical protein Q1695_003652 [Nippostrongylus brasiliensis]|nr:hypothetical protein Q1695_003652 [Nippostrongylus brasiliensis]